MACLSVLPPIFCNTHIRLAGSIVSFWRALFLASRFPIRPATSLCLSAVSPCPSFPRLYKRPISALLRLPPCPAFFCSPILAPSPLFCLFAKHFHTAAYPRSPAVLFLSSCPAAFALFIGRRVPAYFKLCPPCCCYLPLLPFPALCFYCFVLARAFPLYSLLIPPFKALFFLVCIFVSRAVLHFPFLSMSAFYYTFPKNVPPALLRLPPCPVFSTVLLFNLIPLLSYLARPAACFSCFFNF